MNRTIYLLSGVLYFLMLVPSSVAQDLTSGSPYVHEYARPGRPTIDVFIWGGVATPGIWKVEPDVDLLELLSVARVTNVGVDEADFRQRTFLHIYRNVGGQRSEIYTQPLASIVGAGRGYPTLQDGDILEVEIVRRRKFGLGVFAQVVSAAASLTVLILQIANK